MIRVATATPPTRMPLRIAGLSTGVLMGPMTAPWLVLVTLTWEPAVGVLVWEPEMEAAETEAEPERAAEAEAEAETATVAEAETEAETAEAPEAATEPETTAAEEAAEVTRAVALAEAASVVAATLSVAVGSTEGASVLAVQPLQCGRALAAEMAATTKRSFWMATMFVECWRVEGRIEEHGNRTGRSSGDRRRALYREVVRNPGRQQDGRRCDDSERHRRPAC
ncbi:uncharacterized protein BJ171DRAFT_509013 [Polychytrium aggregatum]|uniref:uncharacterized protein n=1 Tax=Polychytrium aggregatum TaxID=110093 RepID=UPI0022FDF6EE|nr:uncharacterized protein BJ171DRAFT_509013 [Polychytrium aggregatum]KAI9203602.1 hypothetical protein BJ171DRAFT_509013 [Polychytrium aggregatum]